MNNDESWREINDWLLEERKIGLPKGEDFRATFNSAKQAIEIIPTKTGIPRRISKKEWNKFVTKFNKVKNNGYDPLRPGHYAQITHNSSYLVAILRESDYLKNGD